ncbi:MAG: Flp1 family type IVb pilin [Acutalibacteraceae bacterium]
MSDLLFKIYFMGCNAKNKAIDLFKKENGETNIIAIVLLIVIVIALAVIFRDSITALVQRLLNKVTTNADGV